MSWLPDHDFQCPSQLLGQQRDLEPFYDAFLELELSRSTACADAACRSTFLAPLGKSQLAAATYMFQHLPRFG